MDQVRQLKQLQEENARLGNAVVDLTPDKQILQKGPPGKLLLGIGQPASGGTESRPNQQDCSHRRIGRGEHGMLARMT